MTPQHRRRSRLLSAIALAKYVVAFAFGLANIVLFSETFISAVAYHSSVSPGITPGRIALVGIGPAEFIVLGIALAASWGSDWRSGPTRVLCCTLGGECALNWVIVILGGGLALITLGI